MNGPVQCPMCRSQHLRYMRTYTMPCQIIYGYKCEDCGQLFRVHKQTSFMLRGSKSETEETWSYAGVGIE